MRAAIKKGNQRETILDLYNFFQKMIMYNLKVSNLSVKSNNSLYLYNCDRWFKQKTRPSMIYEWIGKTNKK